MSQRDVKVVQPSGTLDSGNGALLREEILQIVNSGSQQTILVDFKDVTFMDSSGLGSLVTGLKAVRASGSEIFICQINDQVKMLFELTSMDKVFKVFTNRDEFMEKFNSDSFSH